MHSASIEGRTAKCTLAAVVAVGKPLAPTCAMTDRHPASGLISPRFGALCAFVLLAALARLLPHPPNFAPVAAVALFAGAHFSRKGWAFAVPLAAMLLSDVYLGFHSLTLVVYGAFAASVGIGLLLRHRRSLPAIASASLTSSVLFFVVTNSAVWAFGTLYPKTAAGLAACYVAAIPFFHNTLAGDAFYAAVLFGGWALAERKYPLLRPAPPAS